MIKFRFCFLIIILSIILAGCKEITVKDGYSTFEISDVFGNKFVLPAEPRVVSCFGSFSECWLLSGGELVGVTDDAIKERNLELSDDISVVGTVKDVNLELVVSLDPDYVILSADIAAHIPLEQSLRSMDIPYGYFRVDDFEDYDIMMRSFCTVNGREDLYNKNVIQVLNSINGIVENIPEEGPTYLLMRVYSTGIKVKSDNIADIILKDLGGKSIADFSPSILTDLSVEEIIKCDPDYIFILTMGDELAGERYFRDNIVNNPAWSSLNAIKNERFHILPKELFHYKPNNRWNESYEYIYRIFYPDAFKINEKE